MAAPRRRSPSPSTSTRPDVGPSSATPASICTLTPPTPPFPKLRPSLSIASSHISCLDLATRGPESFPRVEGKQASSQNLRQICTLNRAPVGQAGLRVLVGWPLPLGFCLDGRLLLARRGRVYVLFAIIIPASRPLLSP